MLYLFTGYSWFKLNYHTSLNYWFFFSIPFLKLLLKEIIMFAHKYVTFQSITKLEPVEITIDTEKVVSMGKR